MHAKAKKGGKHRPAGGAATGGGMNFQAAVTTIANIYMARGRPLRWLEKVVDDTPVAVEAETGGGGDDIRLLLRDTQTVEVQVKKGLRAGTKLWKALLNLASAVTTGGADFGVLVVSPTSSNTIANDLMGDVIRIGNGRTDGLSTIGEEFLGKLADAGISAREACANLRIHTVHAQGSNTADKLAAHAELANLCGSDKQISSAWSVLLSDSATLIEQRGRRDVAAVRRLLHAEGIQLKASNDQAPVHMLDKLLRWTLDTHKSFSIFGVQSPLDIEESWIPLTAIAHDPFTADDADLEEALHRYQTWETRSVPRNARAADAETLGRFNTRAVVVAGPGMGKSTLLKRMARRYAEDSIPVLRVRLSVLAQRMRGGATFEEAMFDLGLDGSGIATSNIQNARFPNWTLLCDGLDECDTLQEDVAAGVTRFAAGHPHCRIIVTTRPIGYRASNFKDWHHYQLAVLNTENADTHAAKLLQAIAGTDTKFHQEAEQICRRELGDKASVQIVGRTPLLLSIAAAILVRGKSLGTTRERLFAQIFELIDEAPNTRVPEPPASAQLLRRFLDILGWHLTAHPLGSIDDTLRKCTRDLAFDTGAKPFVALANAQSYLEYWLDVGMVERVGQDGQQVLSFVQKNFGEFAAARYLQVLPSSEREKAVRDKLDLPVWAEVLRLAGLMGMANELASFLLGTTDEAPVTRRIALAVELIADGTPPPDSVWRANTISWAFAIAAGERRRHAYEVGIPLVSAARRFPNEVGVVAAGHYGADRPWTRLIAWACGVAAGPEHYVLDELITTLPEIVEVVGPALRPSLGGGAILAGDDGQTIAEDFVLEACERIIDFAPSEVADSLVPAILNYRNLGSVGFILRATKLVQSKGRDYQIGGKDWHGRSMFNVPKGYSGAERAMYDALFEPLDLPEEYLPEDVPEPRALLHLSAFIAAIQILEVSANDVWAWSKPFDADATREAIKGVIAATGIDRNGIRQDAIIFRRYLNSQDASDGRLFLFAKITDVDPPAVDWARVKTLGLDPKLIEAAAEHPSHWMKWVVGNLLLTLLDKNALKDVASRLLDIGRGRTLWLACAFVDEIDRSEALALLFGRLAKPLASGCDHLFHLLEKFALPWSPDLADAIRVGLFAVDVDTADAAAALAEGSAKPEFTDLMPLLEEANAHWKVHEEPYPTGGGVIPTSPRAKLVEAMRKIRQPTYSEIRCCLIDSRSDMREIGTDMLLDWLRETEGGFPQFLEDIGQGRIAAVVLGKILKGDLPLNSDEIADAERLLRNDDAAIRFNAMALLSSQYLDLKRIQMHAELMTRDDEQQIKDRAFAILDT